MTINKDLKKHLLKTFGKGTRYDGRKLDEFREISVEYDISKSAEGSARVIIGDTEVIAGVKMALETPYPDTPDKGNLMVNAELLPLSSPEFESGPPSIEAIELSRVVDRGIREAEAIDAKKLCIEAGEKVWSVMIDICTINDAGNLLDAASLAAIAALRNAKFPAISDLGMVDYQTKTETPLPLEKEPIAVTVFKIGEYFVVDPLPDESRMYDARLTITTVANGNVCSLQKGGDSPLSAEDIDKMIGLAQEKGKELRSNL